MSARQKVRKGGNYCFLVMHEYFAQVGINPVISRRPEDEKRQRMKDKRAKEKKRHRGRV